MMSQNEINEFQELLAVTDMSEFSITDQLTIALEWVKFIESVKPIYLKNIIKNPEVTNFIMKF